ncbi:MAG: hypothetical protein IRF12RH_07415 [Rickettsia helvetica]|uniref:Uncharacterized protein n=2 Tax=Rickettsia helvetica TaxID=35789 RepID=A0ABM9NDF5_RICHE
MVTYYNDDYPNDDYNSESIESIVKIVEAIPNLVPEAFTFLKEIVVCSKQDLRSKAMENIVKIVKTTPSLTQEVFDFWKEIVTNPKYDINYEIIDKLPEIVKMMLSLTTEAFIVSKEMFTTNNDDDYDYVKAIVADNMVNIVRVNSSIAEEVLEILKEILSNLEYDFEVNYSAAKGLIEVLNLVLPITHHLTQEYEKSKNPEVIEWFTASFNELPNISETRIFLKEICKSILKSGIINELESKFILSCIKKYNFTFTVSINKAQGIEGKIIFEDRNYEIFKNDNSASKIVSLEEFATKLLAETDDPLAGQYKTYKPLFLNKGLTLKIAASDINYVSSIANENTKLSTKKYL